VCLDRGLRLAQQMLDQELGRVKLRAGGDHRLALKVHVVVLKNLVHESQRRDRGLVHAAPDLLLEKLRRPLTDLLLQVLARRTPSEVAVYVARTALSELLKIPLFERPVVQSE